MSEIVLALDVKDLTSAEKILEMLGPDLKYVKIGPRLFCQGGRDFILSVGKNWKVFLDIKLHDIPNTVKDAVSAIAEMGIFGLTLHIAGGKRMLCEAVKGRNEANPDMKLFGVTVLTSINEEEWKAVSPGCGIEDAIEMRTKLADEAGIDGVVCSPRDLESIKRVSAKLLTLVPGVRPEGTSNDDQARTMTPGEAKKKGADFIVIGRPILRASDPLEALTAIKGEVACS